MITIPKRILLICIILLFTLKLYPQINFLENQKRYPRVRTAITEKENLITANLQKHNLALNNFNLIIMVHKDEGELIILAKNQINSTYQIISSYKICSSSGTLGPKREKGDLQVPEGFYFIDRFNPSSRFYLSLGINYPNQADKQKSKAKNLGGDIFIHGSVTIGCIPMTDEKIKEIYLYALYAKNNGQLKIPVYIFPFKMTQKNMTKFSPYFRNNNNLRDFWNNLKDGYDKFENLHKELKISITNEGDYIFE